MAAGKDTKGRCNPARNPLLFFHRQYIPSQCLPTGTRTLGLEKGYLRVVYLCHTKNKKHAEASFMANVFRVDGRTRRRMVLLVRCSVRVAPMATGSVSPKKTA